MSTTAVDLSAAVSRSRPAFILWRHVIQELLPPTLIGFLVFTFLLLMRFLLQLSRLWIQYGAEFGEVLWAMVYSLPHIVVLTLPMGVLVGGLIAFGRMSTDFEIVALRALGVSLMHLLPPVLILSSILWAATSYLFLVALPWGNQHLLEMQWERITQRAFSQEFKPRVFHEDFPGLVLYIEDIVDQGAEWQGVFVAKTDTEPPTILRAERAFPIIDEAARRTYLLLENGTVITSAGTAQDVTIMRFERRNELIWSEAENSMIGEIGKDGRSMTLAELDVAIAERAAAGDPAWDLLVDWHKKFAFPFACVVMGLISLPLGISTQRQATAAGFAIGTGVIMVYYFFAQNGEQMGDVGQIPPWIGMWAGNVVLGVAALFLLWQKARERDLGFARACRRLWERVDESLRGLVRTEPATGTPSRVVTRRRRRRIGFPRTLDRYVLINFSSIYLLAFVSLVLVFTMVTWIDKASYVSHPEYIGQYIRYYVFEIIFDVVPLTAVVAVLATFSLMAKRSEVVAALAGGISLFRLVAPILIPALLLTGVRYGLQDYVLPVTTHQAEIADELMHPTGQATLQRQQSWVFSRGNRVFHFTDFIAQPPEFLGLRIYYLTDGAGGIARVEYANRATWNDAGARWEGHDGWRRFYVTESGADDLRPNPLEEYRFAVLPIDEQPDYFSRSPRQTDDMSTVELQQHIELLREQGYDTHRALVDFHLKIAQPFIVLVMTLVGIPFAFRMGRHGALTGVGVAIALAIVYWIAFGVFRALGYAGQLPPPLAAWAPHLLFIALGGYLALGVRT